MHPNPTRSNKTTWFMGIIAATLLGGCTVRSRPVQYSATVQTSDSYGEVYVNNPPPPMMQEVVSSAPGQGYIWISGYWDWTGYDWYWTNGFWVANYPNAVYVRPSYVMFQGRWVYHRGHFQGNDGRRDYVYGRPAPAQRTVYGQPTGAAPATGWRGNAAPAPQQGYVGSPAPQQQQPAVQNRGGFFSGVTGNANPPQPTANPSPAPQAPRAQGGFFRGATQNPQQQPAPVTAQPAPAAPPVPVVSPPPARTQNGGFFRGFGQNPQAPAQAQPQPSPSPPQPQPQPQPMPTRRGFAMPGQPSAQPMPSSPSRQMGSPRPMPSSAPRQVAPPSGSGVTRSRGSSSAIFGGRSSSPQPSAAPAPSGVRRQRR